MMYYEEQLKFDLMVVTLWKINKDELIEEKSCWKRSKSWR